MEETLKKGSGNTKEEAGKRVIVNIGSNNYVLNGLWRWDMQSDALYASDVMAFPPHFEGTKSIIHPDDLSRLGSALELLADSEIDALDFRVITTYGEVKDISGRRISLHKSDSFEEERAGAPAEEALHELALRKEAEYLGQRAVLADGAERLHGIGCWTINKSTGEAWYSDGMFRLHGLPPQSLNAHANTFNSFIHPDDRTPVLDAFEKAYTNEVPVHLEYRIVPADGAIRHLRQVTAWSFNRRGQSLLSSIVRDLTGEQALAESVQETEAALRLDQQMLRFSEQLWHTGYWFMNIATRKVTYSDNYYRIYGLKQTQLPNNNAFLNLIHPDDRLRVQRLTDDMYRKHELPETEYRIIRPDGKRRHLKQSGKIIVTADAELMMVGIVQDLTVQKGLEKKNAELTETTALQTIIKNLTEKLTATSSIVWYPDDGRILWSEGFYRLLGHRPDSTEPTPRLLHQQIHPDDLKAFKNAETLVLNGQHHDELFFRLVNKGGIRQLRIAFNRVTAGSAEAVVGVVREITQEALLHEKLFNTAAYVDKLADSVSDLIILTDTANNVVYWNDVAVKKTGIKKEEALYQNLFDLLPALRDSRYSNALQLAIEGQETGEPAVKDRYLKKPHRYGLSPVKNEKGEAIWVLHVVQDISKELGLQQQLAERLNFIESLVEASVDRIVVLDRHMNYLYWNKQAEEYYAIGKEKVIGKNILEVFPSLRNDPGYAEFRRVLRGETVYLPPAASEGGDDYVETYLTPIKNEDGEVTAILWIVHDLRNELRLQTERLASQAQLAEEHRRLNEAQAIGRVGSFEWMTGEETSRWSDELFRIHGLQPGEMETTLENVHNLIHPHDKKAAGRLMETSIQKPGSYQETHRIIVKGGEVRWVNHQWECVADASGKVVKVTGVVQDVTEQTKAEHEILLLKDEVAQKATDKYRLLLNSIDEGFYTAEMIFDESGKAVDMRLLEVNAQYERQAGFSKEEILSGKTVKQTILHLQDEWFAVCDKVVRTQEPVRFEMESPHLDKWFEVYASPIEAPELRRVAVVVKDTTVRKKAEEALRQSEERKAFLLKLSDTLHPLSDPVQIHAAAAHLAMNHLKADRSYYCEIESDTAIIRQDAFRSGLPSVAAVYPLADLPVFRAFVQTPAPLIVSDVSKTEALDEALKQLCLDRQIIAFINLPVVKKGLVVGRFCVTQCTPRSWTGFEIELAKETAERSWTKIERARAEAELVRRAEFDAFFLNLSDALRPLTDPVEIQDSATRLIGEYLGVAYATYAPVEVENGVEYYNALRGYAAPGYPSVFGRYRFSDFPGVTDGIRFGEVMIVEEGQSDPRLHAEDKANSVALNVGAYVMLPLIKAGRLTAILAVHGPEPRKWTAVEIAILRETAERTWAAVERARAEKALHESEANLSALFEAMPVGVALMDRVGKIIVSNIEMLRFLPNRLIPSKENERSWRWCGYYPNGQRVEAENYPGGRAMRGEAGGPVDFLYTADDGKEIWTRVNYLPVKEAKGEATRFVCVITDIDNLKRSTEALRESEERLQLSIKGANILTWEVNPQTGETKYSDNFNEALGFEISTTSSDNFINVYPDDKAVVLKAVEEAMKGEAPLDVEHRVIHPQTKEIIWVRAQGQLIKRSADAASVFIGITQNITVRKIAEEALWDFNLKLEEEVAQRTEELQNNLSILKQTEDIAAIGSWEYQIPSGRFSWSDGMYRIFDYPMGAPVQPEAYIHSAVKEDKPIARRIAKHIKEGRGNFEETVRIKRDDGVRLLKVKGAVVKNAAGVPQKVIGVDLDITDIKAAEGKIKEQGQYAQAIIDSSIDQITVFDKDYRFIAWNKRAEEIGGLKKEDVIGRSLFDIFPTVKDDEEFMAAQEKALAGEYAYIPAKRGIYTTSHQEWFYVPLRNEKGETYAVLNIIHDISKRVQAEEELQQKARELEAKNDEITNFAFIASHDLKEPIRKIHTFSNWLMEREADGLSAKGKEYAFKIFASVKRLDGLIDDITTLTKLQAIKSAPAEVALNGVLAEAEAELKEETEASGAVIESKTLPVITGNRSQLVHLFRNLIGNGIKFQEPNVTPVIEITCEKKSGINGLPPGDWYELRFTDNGIGFDVQYAEKIFRVFQRLHGQNQYPGSGIGLAICKKIMENHGGDIKAESTPGNGAVFTCYFPAKNT